MTTPRDEPAPGGLVLPSRFDALCPGTDLDGAGPSAGHTLPPPVDPAPGRSLPG